LCHSELVAPLVRLGVVVPGSARHGAVMLELVLDGDFLAQ
jgi:hypothetical protein